MTAAEARKMTAVNSKGRLEQVKADIAEAAGRGRVRYRETGELSKAAKAWLNKNGYDYESPDTIGGFVISWSNG